KRGSRKLAGLVLGSRLVGSDPRRLPDNEVAVVTYLLNDFSSMHGTVDLDIACHGFMWGNTLQIGRAGGHWDLFSNKLPIFDL
ncbi:MAG TPA: hypothetical protein VIY66_03015, partial [Candidatus Acidoferrales bacterium]